MKESTDEVAKTKDEANTAVFVNKSFKNDGDDLEAAKQETDNRKVIETTFDDVELDDENFFGKCILISRRRILKDLKRPMMRWAVLVLAIIAYLIYFGFVMTLQRPFSFPKNWNSSKIIKEKIFSNNYGLALLMGSVIIISVIVWELVVSKHHPTKISKIYKDLKRKMNSLIIGKRITVSDFVKWWFIILISLGCLIYLFLTTNDYTKLTSLTGVPVLVLISCFISVKPSKIKWIPVITSILIQFILCIIVMRFEFGYELFKFFGTQVERFLAFTDAGSQLVFGESFEEHFFIFKAMPVLIYFSAIVHALFHFGILQYLIIRVSWLYTVIIGTSPCESMNAIASVFLGMTEASIMIKPFMQLMTDSELFAVMTGGFATVAGSTFAAYIGFGIPSNHLLIASIMSAPAALGIAKVIFPETEKINADWNAIKHLPRGNAHNIFEVISEGATSIGKCIAAIVCNVIAFVSIFKFLDAVVAWFFIMLNFQNAGLTTILQYVFWPLALILGVPIEDCLSVGRLIGLKTFVNEFVAYKELGTVITFRDSVKLNNTFGMYKTGTLQVPVNFPMIWNEKSIIIATYALCGFSNFGSIGTQIATLCSLCPSKSKVFVKYSFLGMIGGSIACFMTASIAGLLYQ